MEGVPPIGGLISDLCWKFLWKPVNYFTHSHSQILQTISCGYLQPLQNNRILFEVGGTLGGPKGICF